MRKKTLFCPRYFAELTRSQVESLAEIFRLDLLLFGYDPQVMRQYPHQKSILLVDQFRNTWTLQRRIHTDYELYCVRV